MPMMPTIPGIDSLAGLTPTGGGAAGPGMPGMGSDPMADSALSALDQLRPAGPNPTVAMQKVTQALDLMHKLAMSVLPQIMNMNPKVAKDLHQIAQRILSAKLDIQKETPVSPPPELFQAMGGGLGGSPLGTSPLGGRGGSAGGY